MKTSIIRKPRPLGLTQLSTTFQKTKDNDDLLKLYGFLINHWYVNTGNICGQHYDISTLSSKFNIPKNFIDLFIKDTVISSPIWDDESRNEIINGLLGAQISWAIEDRMEVVNQVNILKASQKGKYTPFISAELNKALKLRLDSSASLQSLVKSFIGGNSVTNFFTQINNQNNEKTENYITIEEGRAIVQESIKLEDKSEDIKYLENQYDLESLPEVVALNQQGVDTSKEGLSLDKVELNSITDNYKGAIQSSSKEHHEFRREIEERIDPDSDDPELDVYEEEELDDKLGFGNSNYLMPQ